MRARRGCPLARHLFTSRERVRRPGGEWSEWVTICSWCGTVKR